MNKQRYKYWVYYVNPDIVDDLTCIINEPNFIYAYTDSKELSNLFEKFHDMRKFIKKKLILTRQEVNNLAHDEMNQYLIKRILHSQDKNGKMIDIECAVTKQEEKHLNLQVMTVLNKLVYNVGINTFPAYALKDEVALDLEKFRFFSIINNQVTCRDTLCISNNCILIAGDKKGPKIYADEVSIYIHLFHNILIEVKKT